VKKLDGNDPNFLPTTQILHHDNAPAHTALSVRESLASKQIIVLEHPPCSPDLAPVTFFSVPEDKGNIERKEC
jgi:transposase